MAVSVVGFSKDDDVTGGKRAMWVSAAVGSACLVFVSWVFLGAKRHSGGPMPRKPGRSVAGSSTSPGRKPNRSDVGLAHWSKEAVLRLGLPPIRVAKIQRRWETFKNGEIVWDWRVGRKITFTFDDGPSPRTTPLLLENLDRAGIRASFFVVGRRIGGHGPLAAKSREVLREEVRRGHLVGLHSYTHPMMIELPHDKQKWEIVSTERAVERTVGLRPYLYRPPFGGRTRYSEGVLRSRGYSVVMWNMSTGDPFVHHPAKVLATAMKKVRKHQGGVFLMHDTYGWSAAAAPLIVRAVLLESCTLLARGEQPYLVVGLEHFWLARGSSRIRQTPAMLAESYRWLSLTRKLCGLEQDKRSTP